MIYNGNIESVTDIIGRLATVYMKYVCGFLTEIHDIVISCAVL